MADTEADRTGGPFDVEEAAGPPTPPMGMPPIVVEPRPGTPAAPSPPYPLYPSGSAPGGPPPYDDEEWEEIPARRTPGGPAAAIVLLVVFGAFAFAAWRAYRWFDEQLDPPGDPGAEVELTLGDGDTASNIADQLEELSVIPNSSIYQWYVRLKGGPSFQAGDYVFLENSAVWEVLDTLRDGPIRVAQAVTFPVAVPEGLTIAEVIAAVDAADLPYAGAAFESALRSREVPERWGPETGTLPEGTEPWEGLLFPDTYDAQAGEPPALLVERMINRFDQVALSVGLQNARDVVSLSPYETLIVASLIEEEAQIDEDRTRIARVIYNRLAQGIPLGIDATIVYATGNRALTVEDLAIESPFNSRTNVGLPPTPIAAPGRDSLEAALNPEPGEWLYYVRTDEGGVQGAHRFVVTPEEFEEAKAVCTQLGYCS